MENVVHGRGIGNGGTGAWKAQVVFGGEFFVELILVKEEGTRRPTGPSIIEYYRAS